MPVMERDVSSYKTNKLINNLESNKCPKLSNQELQ